MKRPIRLLTLLPILLAPGFSSCFLFGSDDDSADEPAEQTPLPSVSYGTPKVRYLRTLEIAPLTPTVVDAAGAEFRIAPAPPAGLAFDEATGTLSGVPTEVSAAADYTVRAVRLRNVGNDDEGEPVFEESTVASTILCIEVLEAEGPSSIRYTLNPATYNTNATITPNVPIVVGLPTLFETNVPLPAGLVLSATSGVISGRPTEELPASDFVVTASNPFGSAQTTLRIQVLGQADASSLLVLNTDGTFSDIRRRPARRFSHRTFRTPPGSPISSAATPDGRFLFVYCADGSLVRYTQTPGVARPDRGTVIGQYPLTNDMLVDGAGERLVMLGSGELRSIEILPDGALGVEQVLTVSDQAFAMDRNPANDLVYVLQSGGALISTFSLRPALARAGADVPTPGYPGHVDVSADGRSVYVSNVTGESVVAFAVQSGNAPLSLLQQVGVAGFIADLEAARGHLYVARDGAQSGLLRLDIAANGSLDDPREFAAGRSIDSLTSSPGEGELYALDSRSREALVFDLFGSSTTLSFTTRTRDGAFELAMLPGPMVFSRTRWVLAADPAARTLGALEIEYGSGSLTAAAAGTVATGADPAAVVMNEAETDVYLAERGSDTVSHYGFDAPTGVLAPRAQRPAGDGPIELALDPSERFLFVLHAAGRSVRRFDLGPDGDPTPAEVTPLPLEEPTNLAFDPTGQYLYVLDAAGTILPFEMDPRTGALTQRAGVAAGAFVGDMGFAVDARHAYVAGRDGELFQFAIDALQGTLSALNPPSVATGLGAASLAANTRFPVLAVACTDSDEVRIYGYDADSGLLQENTERGPLFVYNRPVEALFDFDETYLYVANDDPGLPALRTWCWVCPGVPSEESAYDAGGRLPVLFAGSGMGD